MLRSIYQALLRLHPPGFRREFADEMLWIFDETAESGGVASLFADGFASLVRQWITLPATVTLAAAGMGGAFQMAVFLVLMQPVVPAGPPLTLRIIWPATSYAAPDPLSARFNGSWIGSLRSTGPSGPIQLMLTRESGGWTGQLYLQGPDGRMHGGPLEGIQVRGDSLRFLVEAGDADLTFRGRLNAGKLTGILEATANGKQWAAVPKGKTVGRGTWQLTPITARNAPKPGQRTA